MTELPGLPGYADPAAAAADLGVRVEAATNRVLRTAAGISDTQAREPSLLPGWSRGHVLTHIARNADGLRNLLTWARTGVRTPQYASIEERESGIAAGAGRPAAELRADVEASAASFAAEASGLSADRWNAPVRGLRGSGHPAWYTLWRRLSEVEIHHVDLDAGYGPAHWPDAFAYQCLARVAADFTGPDCPRVTLRATDSGAEYRIGPAVTSTAPARTGLASPGLASPGLASLAVAGRTSDLLAWLIGRGDGAGLTASPAGPLPELPAW